MATLSITFPAVTPAPSLGYRVKYWPTSSPSNITTTTTPTNSLTVPNLTETSYSGTVEAICGGGNYSTPVSFTGAAAAGGAATLAVGIACSSGIGNYNLTGTVGHIVRVRLGINGLLSPTSASWVSAVMGSTNPNFSVIGTSACFQPGASSGVSLELFKNITIPTGGVVNINTSIFANNSTSSMISASLSIVSVNSGANTSTGNTQINGVCVGNSSTGGGCPGVTYVGD